MASYILNLVQSMMNYVVHAQRLFPKSVFRVEVTEVFIAEDEVLLYTSSALEREQESICWWIYFHSLLEYKSFCDPL